MTRSPTAASGPAVPPASAGAPAAGAPATVVPLPNGHAAPVHDPALARIADKVLSGGRVTFEEGMTLYDTPDLPGLAALADAVRAEKVGDKAYYVHSLRLSQTNVCYVGCTFCGFQRTMDQEGVWDMDLSDVWAFVEKHATPDLVEIHISSGHHPKRGWDYYLDLTRGLTDRGYQVKAWTAAEIHHFARIARPAGTTAPVPYREVLAQLQEAGLVALPGGGAEIFAERVRRRIARAKVDADGWLDVHRAAHELGIPTNATMLYGHVETLEERLDHMMRLRTLQDDAPGFMSFVPLAFQPDNNQLAREIGKTEFTTGLDDLRNLAVARVVLDNVPHVKGYWIMITPELVQVSLGAGVSDVDGTISDERIAHASGASTETGISEGDLIRLIQDAGRVPVKRDAIYTELEVHPARPLA
ncbi:MAG: aminofutalosine synthase MqnE [Trueperaceae bacterium]|nr:aminofutalosine synthase MqnE [Trueperaceae bacterium]